MIGCKPYVCILYLMRLWSLDPSMLDGKGLVALWREALLAKKVLEGQTRGYKHHPQLNRFYAAPDPLAAINFYLQEVHREAAHRNYQFDKTKFSPLCCEHLITVTKGQLAYELDHLRRKVEARSPAHRIGDLAVHPLFSVVEGAVENWEIL